MADTNAVATVESLIKLGTLIADKKGAADWDSFLAGPDYQTISNVVLSTAQSLDRATIQATISAINDKQAALLGPKGSLSDLPTDKLLQYADLGNLKLKLLATKGYGGDIGAFGRWLVDDALPVILQVAPVVIPLLL